MQTQLKYVEEFDSIGHKIRQTTIEFLKDSFGLVTERKREVIFTYNQLGYLTGEKLNHGTPIGSHGRDTTYFSLNQDFAWVQNKEYLMKERKSYRTHDNENWEVTSNYVYNEKGRCTEVVSTYSSSDFPESTFSFIRFNYSSEVLLLEQTEDSGDKISRKYVYSYTFF